jgi:hypothetical protein
MTTPPGQPGWDRPPHGRPGADEPDPAGSSAQPPAGEPYDPAYAPPPAGQYPPSAYPAAQDLAGQQSYPPAGHDQGAPSGQPYPEQAQYGDQTQYGDQAQYGQQQYSAYPPEGQHYGEQGQYAPQAQYDPQGTQGPYGPQAQYGQSGQYDPQGQYDAGQAYGAAQQYGGAPPYEAGQPYDTGQPYEGGQQQYAPGYPPASGYDQGPAQGGQYPGQYGADQAAAPPAGDSYSTGGYPAGQYPPEAQYPPENQYPGGQQYGGQYAPEQAQYAPEQAQYAPEQQYNQYGPPAQPAAEAGNSWFSEQPPPATEAPPYGDGSNTGGYPYPYGVTQNGPSAYQAPPPSSAPPSSAPPNSGPQNQGGAAQPQSGPPVSGGPSYQTGNNSYPPDPYAPPAGYDPRQPDPAVGYEQRPPERYRPPGAPPTSGPPAGYPSSAPPAGYSLEGLGEPAGAYGYESDPYGTGAQQRPASSPPYGGYSGSGLPAVTNRPTGQHSKPETDSRLGPPGDEPPRRRFTGILVGVIVLVLVAAGIGGFLYFKRDDNKTSTAQPKASATVASADPSASASPSVSATGSASADKLNSRTTDPQPLALTAFSQPTYTLSTSGSYTRTGQETGTDCAKAVDGAAVTLVSKLKCSQVTSVTAVNKATGCVDSFGALNFPDAATAAQAETAIKGGKAGSFVPRRHSVATEGLAGRKDWWFYRKAYGHWLVFSTGAYSTGKVAAKDKVIDACAQDFLYYVIDALDKR